MKSINSNIKTIAILLSVAFLYANSCLAQDINSSNTGLAFEELHPVIRGQASNDVVSARQVTWKEGKIESHPFVFVSKATGQAIVAHSTNDVCFFKGKLFTVDSAGPSQAVFINISQSFGTNEFSNSQALAFRARIAGDYYRPDSSHRKFIELKSILQTESESSHSAMGTPLRKAELMVENGKLVLLFESFTGIKGKVILDDQLNPVSMAITNNPNSK